MTTCHTRNVKINYNGEEMCLMEASEKSGINYKTLQYRYYKGKRGVDLFKPTKKGGDKGAKN